MTDKQEQAETLATETSLDPDVPDFYVDSFSIGHSPFTVVLDYSVKQRSGGEKPLVRLRMSPQHAKAVAIVMRNVLKSSEVTWGRIPLPPELLTQFGLTPESDW